MSAEHITHKNRASIFSHILQHTVVVRIGLCDVYGHNPQCKKYDGVKIASIAPGRGFLNLVV